MDRTDWLGWNTAHVHIMTCCQPGSTGASQGGTTTKQYDMDVGATTINNMYWQLLLSWRKALFFSPSGLGRREFESQQRHLQRQASAAGDDAGEVEMNMLLFREQDRDHPPKKTTQ